MPTLSALNSETHFETFFQDPVYLDFKNHLYNYQRRRYEVRKALEGERETGILLEIGSGVSPISDGLEGVVLTDISAEAMKYLKLSGLAQNSFAMSATELCFKDQSISTIVCSEVIEHIQDDTKALSEMSRVLKKGGSLILTVPLHSYFYLWDDSFVKHYRRYEIDSLLKQLSDQGFGSFRLSKVTAILDKATQMLLVLLFRLVNAFPRSKRETALRHHLLRLILPFYKVSNRIYSFLVKWEAKIMPLPFTTVLLISCKKNR